MSANTHRVHTKDKIVTTATVIMMKKQQLLWKNKVRIAYEQKKKQQQNKQWAWSALKCVRNAEMEKDLAALECWVGNRWVVVAENS